MKIIIAKKCGTDEPVYINASTISSFHRIVNADDKSVRTKIYFSDGKCEVDGDVTKKLCQFMAKEEDSGFYDTTEVKSGKTYWNKDK